MVVILLERVPPSLRGELTRWLLEPKAGVFVGSISAMVRQKLWEKVCRNAGEGSCVIIWSSNTEQGFQFDFWNAPSRYITDWEGLKLVTRPKKA